MQKRWCDSENKIGEREKEKLKVTDTSFSWKKSLREKEKKTFFFHPVSVYTSSTANIRSIGQRQMQIKYDITISFDFLSLTFLCVHNI